MKQLVGLWLILLLLTAAPRSVAQGSPSARRGAQVDRTSEKVQGAAATKKPEQGAVTEPAEQEPKNVLTPDQRDEMLRSIDRSVTNIEQQNKALADEIGTLAPEVDKASLWANMSLVLSALVLAISLALLVFAFRIARGVFAKRPETRQVTIDTVPAVPPGTSPQLPEDDRKAVFQPPPARAPERTPPTPPKADSSANLRAIASDLSTLPHGKVAMLLSELQQDAPRLAQGFGDARLRERFVGELCKPLLGRLIRFTEACEEGEAALRERWIEPDLVSTLDTLARYLSEAVQEGRQGHPPANQLASELKDRLYRRFDKACRAEGWFGIDPVIPYETRFDPAFHHAIAGKESRGAAGLILSIRSVGHLHPARGHVLRKAEVIVGN